MPAVAAMLVRAAIQFAITYGLVELGSYLVNSAVKLVSKLLGATEEQATDVVANEWLQAAERIAIGALVIKSKTPTIIAEKLGFTSKGFVLRPSSISTNAISTTASAAKNLTLAERTAAIAEAAPAIATKARTTFDKVQAAAQFMIAGLGIPVGVGLLITNTIDFGAWSSSAYQNQFQKFLSIFGLEPDADYVKFKVLSEDMGGKILAIFTTDGATGIKDPQTGATLPFNRDNFIKIADFVAREIILEQGEVKTKQMIAAMSALVVYAKGLGAATVAAPSALIKTIAPVQQIKVFTGVVSQGTLGSGIAFTPRPNDIITTIDDLQMAAQNNLAAYLVAFADKLVYEIKIVSSVTTKDGFKQVGKAQQIVTGYNTDGTPKYRTLVNKFAVLTLYALTDKNTRTKLQTIVLGPTDAVKLNPTQGALRQLEGTIQQSISTSDINDISTVQTTQPLTITPPTSVASAAVYTPPPQTSGVAQTPGALYEVKVDGLPAGFMAIAGQPIYTSSSSKGDILVQDFIYEGKYYSFTVNVRNEVTLSPLRGSALAALQAKYPGQQIPESAIDSYIYEGVKERLWRAAVQTVLTNNNVKGQDAQTLYDWYTANGLALPSVEVRSALYEKAGLGQAAYYTGTAEQNGKLLAYLKSGVILT